MAVRPSKRLRSVPDASARDSSGLGRASPVPAMESLDIRRWRGRRLPVSRQKLPGLGATPAFARSIELKGAGTALWIFLIVGSVIVLLQLIPATILFFSFIGTASTTALKKEKKVEEEVVLPGSEPAAVSR